jgi:hypothetical protein
MSKFEKLLDLLVNENKDEAEKVFHEIVVEKSRQIYEGILAEEDSKDEAEATDESADKDEADEVEEAKNDEDTDADAVEETEEPAEATEETVEEIGGDATDDLLADIEAEAEGDDMDNMDDEPEAEADAETEEVFEPLEKELDALKAEFSKMMDDKPEEADESVEDTVEEPAEESATLESADKIVKEYAEMVKDGHGAEKMGSEKAVDSKKAVVANKNKPINNGKAVKFDEGGDQGNVTPASAKPMGTKFANSGGHKNVKGEASPKPMTVDTTKSASPVASK